MGSKFYKHVRELFARRLKEELPQFKPLKGVPLPPGDRVFEWKPGGDLRFYLELSFRKNFDAFTVSVVWTDTGSFPLYRTPYGPDEHIDGVTCFSIERLWDTGQCFKQWHLVTGYSLDELVDLLVDSPDLYDSLAMEGIEPAVEDAISKIKEYAIPYFRRVAQEQGHEV